MAEDDRIADGIRYNKDAWTLITGTFVSSAEDAVSYELDKCERQLHLGVNVYLRSDANKVAEEKLRSSETEEMVSFLERLVTLLDVDMMVAFDILGYYVLYEFRGSAEGMRDMISIEGHKNMLIQDIWLFYRSERMFLLKCINFLWTYFYDDDHKFHTLYGNLLKRHTLDETFEAISNQMVSVMNEKMPTVSSHGRCMTERFQAAWFISNMHEQIQTIHNMIVYLDICSCSMKEFEHLFLICKSHSFGYDCDPPPLMNKEFEYFREIIGQLESILLLVALDLKFTQKEEVKLFTDGELFRRLLNYVEALGTQPAHAPLILAWMALFVRPDQPFLDPSADFFKKHGGRIAKLQVFPYLSTLLMSTTFQNASKLKRIAFDCVEKLIYQLVESFAVAALVPMPGLFELAAAVLTEKPAVDRFWDADRSTGLWLIVKEAMRNFPRHFLPLASIVESLARSGSDHAEQLMHELETLSTYMEASKVCALPQMALRADTPGMVESTSARHPADGNANVTFPAGTQGRFWEGDEPSIQWEFETNYFVVLVKELSDLLAQISRGSNYVSETTYVRALAGIKSLYQLVENQCEMTKEVTQSVGLVFNLLDKFSVSAYSPGELLAACLDVACAMLMMEPETVGRRLTAMRFLPAVDISRCTDPALVARGDFFYMRTVGFVVTNHESAAGKYPLLFAYLRFVDRVMEPNTGETIWTTLENNVEIILPCLVFVATTVFPNYESWAYENPDMDRANIAYRCLRILHLILSPDTASELSVVMDTLRELPRPKDSVKRIAPYLLHQTALYSLLETDTSVALIKVIGVGDRYLQDLMERQPDWLEGCGVLFTNNLILAMSVLNRVLLFKGTFQRDGEMSNIELLLLSHPPNKCRPPAITPAIHRPPATSTASAASAPTPNKNKVKLALPTDKVRVVHVIANYIFHSFNPRLPVMAVKLLKRFALTSPISMMSCLGPNSQQICQHFLFRLHSRRESIDLKVAILELMTAGISGQPGLSEAFLNLTGESGRDWSSLDYISSMLDQLQTAPETVAVMLHHNVIALVHALWTTYSQRVLDHLRLRKTFWNGICAPFFLMPLAHEIPLYSKIIVICTLEMKWFGANMAPTLASNLKMFFDCDSAHFSQWSQFVSDSFGVEDNPTMVGYVEELALTWRNFFTVLVKFCPFELNVRQKKMIFADTMQMLMTEMQMAKNQAVVRHVSDAMLILVTNWKLECLDDSKEVSTDNLLKLMLQIHSSYNKLVSDCKESLLAFCLRMITLLSAEISADDSLAASMMHVAVMVASSELSLVVNGVTVEDNANNVDNQPVKIHSCLGATLSLCLVQKMLNMIGGTSFWRVSFSESKLVHQLVDAVEISLGTPSLFNLAVKSLELLILLSFTDISKTLVVFRVGDRLWMSLLPPVDTMSDGRPWFMGKWSRVYERGMRLATRLLAVHGHLFIPEAVSLIGIHEAHMIRIMLGIRYCVKPDLLRLAVATLDFLQTLQQFGIWRDEHPSSFFNVNRSVVSTLDRCIAYLLQPYILRAAVECTKPFARCQFGPIPFWVDLAPPGAESASIPCTPTTALVIKGLLDCINMCLTVLNPLGPSYLSVMTDVLDTEIPIVPLAEATYTTPAVENDPQGRFSLGTLLSVVSLCTRAYAEKASEVEHGFSPINAMQSGDKYLSNLAVPQLTYALEVSLSMMLAQMLVSATNTDLSRSDRHKIMLVFANEVSVHTDNVKRFVLGEEPERQLTPSPEKPAGGSGGGLKRVSGGGGRVHCSRRLEFAPASPAKRSLIDGNPPDPLEASNAGGSKGLTCRVAPRYQPERRGGGGQRRQTSRQYLQLVMLLYQSAFDEAYRAGQNRRTAAGPAAVAAAAAATATATAKAGAGRRAGNTCSS